jgi:hypothetical protein
MTEAFADLGADELRELLADFAKNWLAHDGVWFQAVEQAHGLEAAMAADTEAWRRFAPIEARRIMRRFDIADGGGLEALAQVLSRRMYAAVNEWSIEGPTDGVLRFHMVTCRVQVARHRKSLPPFPCKPVGTVEFTSLAQAVDPRIQVRCLACPPDQREDDAPWCAWEFTLADG